MLKPNMSEPGKKKLKFGKGEILQFWQNALESFNNPGHFLVLKNSPKFASLFKVFIHYISIVTETKLLLFLYHKIQVTLALLTTEINLLKRKYCL